MEVLVQRRLHVDDSLPCMVYAHIDGRIGNIHVFNMFYGGLCAYSVIQDS
jgi:hypothetical protein